ncbi:MAG: hypothetical protein ACLRVT_02510 [Oscillospiraceae bacterium]
MKLHHFSTLSMVLIAGRGRFIAAIAKKFSEFQKAGKKPAAPFTTIIQKQGRKSKEGKGERRCGNHRN